MNIILFEPAETARPLPRSDARAVHLLRVLRLRPGDSFDAGTIDGPKGKGTLLSVTEAALELRFVFEETVPPALDPITLIVGTPRPIMARRMLQEAASMGVEALHFVASDKCEASYAQSSLWSQREWRRHLIAGAQQAFDTRLPRLTHGRRLAEVIEDVAPTACRLALDNYEATASLADVAVSAPAVLALGPERGWSAAERDLLRAAGFQVVHLGTRVLRLETACVASVMLVKARLGLLL